MTSELDGCCCCGAIDDESSTSGDMLRHAVAAVVTIVVVLGADCGGGDSGSGWLVIISMFWLWLSDGEREEARDKKLHDGLAMAVVARKPEPAAAVAVCAVLTSSGCKNSYCPPPLLLPV